MKTSHRRIALLTGASIAALGISTPVLAAPHDTLADGAYPGASTTDDTVEICDLATPPGTPCFFGVIDTTGASSLAVINSVPTGWVTQTVTGTTGLMSNGGSAEFGAIAIASGAAANATASASSVVYQTNFAGAGAADLSIANSGTWLFDAVASAVATAGAADANARISDALHQQGTGTDVALAIVNDGSLSFLASANAVGTSAANANATVSTAIYQHGTGDTVALSLVNNSAIDIGAVANAVATAGVVAATADINNAISQFASAPGGDAFASMTNAGTIAIHATAAVTGDAYAGAFINGGIFQQAVAGTVTEGFTLAFVTSTLNDAFVGMSNTGAISMTASAFASDTGTGPATAQASVTAAISQSAIATGNAGVSLVNGGSISLAAIATANAVDTANATANVSSAIVQFASGSGTASAFLSNSGTLSIAASASANAAEGPANASANVGSFFNAGINQWATAASTAAAIFANSGAITINGHAAANAVATADATALNTSGANATAVGVGVYQFATASTAAIASISNSGTMSIGASATAVADGDAHARAIAFGAFQSASASTATASFFNGGAISVAAIANATAGTGATGTLDAAVASATATATGLIQNANGGSAIFSNSGTFSVAASANAVGSTSANAGAFARGVVQNGNDTTIFDNSGSFSVNAVASASASSGTAQAGALGYQVSGVAVALDVTNDGIFSVAATAAAPGVASAAAVGLSFNAVAGTGVAALVSGTIENSGTMNVVANASGGTYTTVTGVGTTATTLVGATSNATATGIYMSSGVNTATINNSGSITVDAITANGDAVTDPLALGGNATANGILVVGNGTGTPPGLLDILTINNSGDIIVRESGDGGATWTRGMAIDVALAPNPAVINLLGGGNIYGHIDINSDDVINVDNGETAFDGIINPEFLPVGGVTELDLDTGLFGQGPLNITDDGVLFLRDRSDEPAFANQYDGPSYAFIETLNMVPGATLIYELPTSNTGGTQPVGTYPQIFTNVANIDGNLLIRPSTANGLFDDDYFYDNVIDAVTRNGTFDTCGLDGTYADSAFLTLTCIYDTANNVDLGLERTPFDAIPGLTRNQQSTSEGLECIYDPDLTGGMADVLADLFTFNAVDYAEALDQLGGAAYASYLQSFSSLGVHYNDILAKATDCEVPTLAGSVLECRTSPTHIWAQIDFQNRKSDGDSEAGRNDADRWTAIMGFDVSVGNAAIVGASMGRVTNRMDFNQSNNEVKADGYQVGLYGVYDPGAFYVKALGTYNWFDGDSERNIDFRPFGGAVVGQLEGDPDVNLWTLGLHGGYRIAMGASSVVTPYLNLDYTNAKLKGFTEGGLVGPELTVQSSSEKRTTLTGGVKWAADIGGVVPEVDLGYRYQFGDERSNFHAHFLGDGCEFNIISEREKRGSLLAGLSLGGKAGPVDVRVSYQGLFNGDTTSHAGNFKIVLPFGGRAAPPPPPPEPVAPPPPPPPVVEEAPPPPPPPPPPPEPSGERG